jgi:hypothetical protein
MSDQDVSQSPDERMMALLGAEEPTQEQEVTQEPQETEAPQADSQEQPPRKLKLKWNEQEIEKEETEVIELAQQGFDYTQKTQKLAEERRSIESQAQAVKAQEQQIKEQASFQAALIKDIAKVTSVDEQLAEYDKVNWAQLTDQDPSYAQKLFFQYTQLRDRRNTMVQELNQKQTQMQQQHQSKIKEMLAKGYEQLQRDIPGWNDEKASEVRSFAKSIGFSEHEISQITDPKVVKALYNASQYEKLQSSKPTVANKVADKPPVVKPGSRDPKASQNSQSAQLKQELRKTGKSDVAAKLIEQMLK